MTWKDKYYKYLQSEQWKNIRAGVLGAANGRCKCGSLATQVHHKTYENVFHEVADDLVALCNRCHESVHRLKIRKDNLHNRRIKKDPTKIEVDELSHIADIISDSCDINKKQSNTILELFFDEIRNAMLDGKKIDIRGLGIFQIHSPKTSNTKERIFAKFKSKKSLLDKMNVTI